MIVINYSKDMTNKYLTNVELTYLKIIEVKNLKLRNSSKFVYIALDY